jgi:hypothetical protein
VKTTRHLVAVVIELAAGVKHRQHHFRRGLSARVLVDRDPAAVVDDGHRIVDVQRDVDLVAETRERLVDRVVDDLIDEMVQPWRAGRPDVHGRTLPDSLQPFEDLDLVRAVVVHTCAIATIGVEAARTVAGRTCGTVVGRTRGLINRARVSLRRLLIVVLTFYLRHSVFSYQLSAISYQLLFNAFN